MATSRLPRIVRLVPVLDFGGVETRVLLQSSLIDRRTFDFRVCTFWKAGDAAKRIEDKGIIVDVLGVDPSVRNWRAPWILCRYLREVRPTIVHASIAEANAHLAIACKFAGTPIAIVEEVGVPVRSLRARMIYAALYRNVDAIVAVSKATRSYLVEKEFAPQSEVHLIYNSTSSEFFEAPLAKRASGDAFEIIAVGRLVEVKNHIGLVRAFSVVAKRYPHVKLRIVGDGPLRDKLNELVAELGLHGQVSLSGFRRNVRDLIDAADVFAFPSLAEGFGLALVEGMARAKPVIASNTGAIPEILADYDPGWMLEPFDVDGWSRAMERLVQMSPHERNSLGQVARRCAERFSPHNHILEIEQLYQRLIEENCG
jgi:glycosyltransferase involved in cell wall biosynthesis